MGCLARSSSSGNTDTSPVKTKIVHLLPSPEIIEITLSVNLPKEEARFCIDAGEINPKHMKNEVKEFHTAGRVDVDALHPDVSEKMLSLLSEENRKWEDIIQVLKVKVESKKKRFRFWKKATVVVFWSVNVVAFGAVLTVSIVVPPMAPVATACSTTVLKLVEDSMSRFLSRREAKVTEMETKTERIKIFWSEFDMTELKLEHDKLIKEKNFAKARKGLEKFQKKVVKLEEEFAGFIRSIKYPLHEVGTASALQ